MLLNGNSKTPSPKIPGKNMPALKNIVRKKILSQNPAGWGKGFRKTEFLGKPQDYLQIIMVFTAFLLMILMGSFFVGHILRTRLQAGAEEALFAAEGNIKAGLAEAEVTLLNSYYVVRSMIDREASQEEILAYLTDATGWMRQRDEGLMSFHGIHGYIRGEFIDSIGLNPGSDYIPQQQPWYQAAVRSGNKVVYTVPYQDAGTGKPIISAARNIDNRKGEIHGILAVDIDITWLVNYVSALKLAPGGYGMLVSQNMTLISHPCETYLGRRIQDLASPGKGSAGSAYIEISPLLWRGGEVSGRRITDTNGTLVTVFFRHMANGWHVGIVTPYRRFYRDLFYAVMGLTVLGFLLACFLSYMLLRLSAAKFRADQENKSKSSFLARMSHEIRTPMNAVIGMSELALREDLGEQGREYVSNIRQAGDNLLSIINDILDFSRVESGKLELINADYILSSLLNDITSIIRIRLNEKPVSFAVRADGILPSILCGDESRIRQVLLNILDNAVKYTREGSITLTVKSDKISAPVAGDTIFLSFEIADTGVGIKPENVEKLFEEFFRINVKASRNIQGTGLGLTITRALCVLMGGSITVDSRYGQGSVFTVSLPQTVIDPRPFTVIENQETKNNGAYRKVKKPETRFTAPDARVLVVDDIATNLSVAKGLLSPYKMRVDCCNSGLETLRLVEKNSYDIVFLDHMMPGMDGIETAAAIRALNKPAVRGLTLIALTANAISGMKDMFLKNGFNDYLAKPIELAKLDGVLEKWIPKSKQQKPAAGGQTGNKAPDVSPAGDSQTAKLPTGPLFSLAGLDAARGIVMTGGTEAGYRRVLAAYRRDAFERLPLLENPPDGETLPSFIIQVHSLKSASATIGAEELSKEAAALEAAGKAKDFPAIREKLPGFRKRLARMVEQLGGSGVLKEAEAGKDAPAPGLEGSLLLPLLVSLKEAFVGNDLREIDYLMEKMEKLESAGEEKALLSDISNRILMAEYDQAREALEKYLG
jgi:signal transduction histidine kinase/HPt (histidine-containing phosphotransfer) domain-containing protein/ActR/RegA family two-component response regulator